MYKKQFSSSYGGASSSRRQSSGRSFSPRRSSGHSGQSRFSGSRTRSRFNSRPQGRGRGTTKFIDPSKFINKAVITEEVDKFIPEHSFVDFKISDILKSNIVKKGYSEPTPIQDKVIPHILAGQDVFGIANTGTGKTAAFLIPLIEKVLINKNEQVLVVVPTRELAVQIEDEFKGFSKNTKLFSLTCVGGVPISGQLRGLRYKNHFIVGTPGRLKDLIERGNIKPEGFNTIVLDEADRMLDMGFINDMRFIINKMPKVRHTLFFSATATGEIEKLTKEFLKNPVLVSVKTGDTAKNVDQDIVRVGRGADKLDVLHGLLNQEDFSRVLIFAKTKHGAEKLSKQLIALGFKSESIHGNKTQSKRQRALASFRNNSVQILVATDVAARGLDIDDVSHVINYDLPSTYDDYVHRIGRTGRGSKKGKALTFV